MADQQQNGASDRISDTSSPSSRFAAICRDAFARLNSRAAASLHSAEPARPFFGAPLPALPLQILQPLPPPPTIADIFVASPPAEMQAPPHTPTPSSNPLPHRRTPSHLLRPSIGMISVINKHQVKWAIRNFLHFRSDDFGYPSPTFALLNRLWLLKIYPNGDPSKNSTGWISLYLELLDGSESSLITNFSFSVEVANGNFQQKGPELTWVLFKEGDLHGLPKFLQRSEVKTNYLTLTCTFRTEKDLESTSLGSFSQNLTDLLISARDCDATLKVGEKEFPVHRLILSARSSVFKTMFEINMKERHTGLVSIEDCDPEVFEEFLQHLYSGKMPKAPKNTFELYKIADKYDMGDLKSWCVTYILANLSVENFLDAAKFGRQFDIEGLKRGTQNFFNNNFRKFSERKPYWKAFLSENPTLAMELLENLADD